jgi:hypothetical protein
LAIYGPTIGMPPAKPAIVAKKSPNRTRMPYSSMRNPKKAQRMRISVIPAAKAAVPFHFCRRAKKASVFWVPMIKVRPIRKRICRSSGGAVRGQLEGEVRCPWPACSMLVKDSALRKAVRTWRGQKTS